MTYRIHYNPIYKFWELQRERPSSFTEGQTFWETVGCFESEEKARHELEIARSK